MALIGDALRTCDIELRQVLAGNIVLTGGGSQFTGIADRLASEITRTFPHVRIRQRKVSSCPLTLFETQGKNSRAWQPHRTPVRGLAWW